MEVVEALQKLGGLATRAALVEATTRKQVDDALAADLIVVLARGRYALPDVDEARAAAHRLTGVVALRSAALSHGWEVKVVPPQPEIILPRNRRIAASRLSGVLVKRANLVKGEVVDGVTSRDRTIVDCLRHLPADEALVVADSALRSGFSQRRLSLLATSARGPGADSVQRIAAAASGDAANVFESSLRAITLEVPGLRAVPQVSIRDPHFLGRPDLVDKRLGIIMEADSFEWHGKRAALRADTQRYNRFAVHGWLVLRFAYEDVMFEDEWVREVLTVAVTERTVSLCPRCRAA